MEESRIDIHAPAARERAAQELQTLFRETIALFHCLQTTAATVHGQENLTAGLRGVLVGLAQGGAQTVPQMARQRPTSRQHIQVLVNRLQELGLVLLEENPDHRRSKLVRITEKGERTVALIRDREDRLLALAAIPVSDEEIASTVATLRTVRTVLTGSRLRQLVGKLHQPGGTQDE